MLQLFSTVYYYAFQILTFYWIFVADHKLTAIFQIALFLNLFEAVVSKCMSENLVEERECAEEK